MQARCSLGQVFGRQFFFKFLTCRLGDESSSVVVGKLGGVFLVDGLALLSVITHKLKEALVSASLNAIDLEGVPAFVKEGLGVALDHGEAQIVPIRTLGTDEDAKGHNTMAASVILAVDAEGVKLLGLDSVAEVGSDGGTLNVTSEVLIEGDLRDGLLLLLRCGLVLG